MKWHDLADKLNILLNFDREIVGVKFVYDEKDWGRYAGKEFNGPAKYCVAVKAASAGTAIKMRYDKCSCVGADRALGFRDPLPEYFTGESACRLGLFDDPAISAKVSADTKMMKKGTYGVVVKPLGELEEAPDCVIIITNSYNAMRIMQGYANQFGLEKGVTLSGNQALCVECTANPLLRDDVNISMLCSGTRFYAQWKETELGVGIPYSKLEGVVTGIRKTVNAIEMDERKGQIIEALQERGENTDDLVMGHTYYFDKKRG